jgi:hypothetical protein
MSAKYIFYDLETTGRGKKEYPNAFGTTPKWEQIMQIAAIVTDENFQETNQNINEFCRPRLSIISQPGALLTTQNGIREALHAKQSSYEIDKILLSAKTIVDRAVISFKNQRITRKNSIRLFKEIMGSSPLVEGSAIALSPDLNIKKTGFKILYSWHEHGKLNIEDRISPENDYKSEWFNKPYSLKKEI